jgi:CxxC-x17-CxxC domain-containing protein
MKKRAKAKAHKSSSSPGPVLPDLVTAMMKLVERLESLERKTDQMFGRVSNLPSDMRRAIQELHPPQPFHHVQSVPRPPHGSQPQSNSGPHERILYQAVCADCCKRCEVPFKPSGDRPVYCPACFAIRKAGHVPKDLTSQVVVPHHLREKKIVSPVAGKAVVAPKGKKPAPKAAKKTVGKKK